MTLMKFSVYFGHEFSKQNGGDLQRARIGFLTVNYADPAGIRTRSPDAA
jgi:hypothetical protein